MNKTCFSVKKKIIHPIKTKRVFFWLKKIFFLAKNKYLFQLLEGLKYIFY